MTPLPAVVTSVTTALDRVPLGATATTTSPFLKPLPDGRKTEVAAAGAALATTEPAGRVTPALALPTVIEVVVRAVTSAVGGAATEPLVGAATRATVSPGLSPAVEATAIVPPPPLAMAPVADVVVAR